jgi:hypothetical protein
MEAQLSPAPHASRWICGMALTSSTATRPLSFASQRTLAYINGKSNTPYLGREFEVTHGSMIVTLRYFAFESMQGSWAELVSYLYVDVPAHLAFGLLSHHLQWSQWSHFLSSWRRHQVKKDPASFMRGHISLKSIRIHTCIGKYPSPMMFLNFTWGNCAAKSAMSHMSKSAKFQSV